MAWSFERVAGPVGFTEGPVWDGDTVRFTDIPTSRVLAYAPATGDAEPWFEGEGRRTNGLALGPDGALYGCEWTGRRVSRYRADGTAETVVETYRGDRLNGPNDLAFDRAGRLWFTDPWYDADWMPDDAEPDLDHRSVYRGEPDGDGGWTVERATTDTTNPNGLAFSPDGATLYVAQSDFDPSADRELRAYPVGDGGTLGEHRVLHDFRDHRGVDGMAVAEDGTVVAAAGWDRGGPGPVLYAFAPDGEVLDRHQYPGPAATNCCFGGPDRSTLYATGYDGGLWRAETDLVGLALPPT